MPSKENVLQLFEKRLIKEGEATQVTKSVNY